MDPLTCDYCDQPIYTDLVILTACVDEDGIPVPVLLHHRCVPRPEWNPPTIEDLIELTDVPF